MSTRNGIRVFDSLDATVGGEKIIELSADYNISCQIFWSGLIGEAKFQLFYSLNAVNWDKYPLSELESGVIYYDIPIVGGSDSFTFKLNNIGSGWVKFVIVSNTATSGTIDGLANIMDNKHY